MFHTAQGAGEDCIRVASNGYCTVDYVVPHNTTEEVGHFAEALLKTTVRSYEMAGMASGCLTMFKAHGCLTIYPQCTEEYPYGRPVCRKDCGRAVKACKNYPGSLKVTECDHLPDADCATLPEVSGASTNSVMKSPVVFMTLIVAAIGSLLFL